MTEIRYVKWGYAWYTPPCGDKSGHICLNEELKKYPELHDYVLAHEMEHATQKRDGSYLTKEDYKSDIGGLFCKWDKQEFAALKFAITHPRTWTQLSPIAFRDGNIAICPTSMWLWCIFAIIMLLQHPTVIPRVVELVWP